MAVTLNASTSSGLVQTADTSGEINIQSNGTTVLGVTSTGATITGTQSVSGNLSFNSGYGSSAVAYGCRAWVNFNGTGTVAIRASGNIASITDNGTGDYTVVIDNDMPDANYAVAATGKYIENAGASTVFGVSIANFASNPLAGSVRVVSGQANNTAQFDFLVVCVSIFR